MKRMLSIDPGDKHVGFAIWHAMGDDTWAAPSELTFGCVWAGEFTPEDALDALYDQLESCEVRWVVVEQWRLRAEEAPKLVGQTMETCKLIGKFEFMLEQFNAACAKSQVEQYWIDLVMQEPSIKKPTYAICKAKGHKLTANVLGVPPDHAQDAEIHGVHFIKQNLKARVAKAPNILEGAKRG